MTNKQKKGSLVYGTQYRKELKKEQNNRRIKQDQKQFKAIMKKSKKLKEKEKGIRSWRRFPKRKKFLS